MGAEKDIILTYAWRASGNHEKLVVTADIRTECLLNKR
jgi:hypothetical protein